jgi:hypothetical protein
VKIGFDQTTGQLQFVFEADELREAQQLLALFHGDDSPEVAIIEECVELWATAMEHKQ